jgi:hypothetical protein
MENKTKELYSYLSQGNGFAASEILSSEANQCQRAQLLESVPSITEPQALYLQSKISPDGTSDLTVLFSAVSSDVVPVPILTLTGVPANCQK